jgi:hypothetical protein
VRGNETDKEGMAQVTEALQGGREGGREGGRAEGHCTCRSLPASRMRLTCSRSCGEGPR